LLQLHPAATFAVSSLDGITGTRAAAIAEKQSTPFQTDPFYRIAATAASRIGWIQAAATTFLAIAKQGFIVLDLQHVMPAQRLAAGAVAWLLAERVAIATLATVTGIENIGSLSGDCCARLIAGHPATGTAVGLVVSMVTQRSVACRQSQAAGYSQTYPNQS